MILRFIVLSISPKGTRSCEFIEELSSHPTRSEYESMRQNARRLKHNITKFNFGAEVIVEDIDRRAPIRSKYDDKRAEIIDRAMDRVDRLIKYTQRSY